MGILKATAIGVGFSVLVASAPHSETAAGSGFSDVSQATPGFTLYDQKTQTSMHDFSGADAPKVIKQGLYDRQLGIACTWTLAVNNISKESELTGAQTLYNVENHTCQRGAEPQSWQKVQPLSRSSVGIKHVSGALDLYGDKSQIVQLSIDVHRGDSLRQMYSRLWDANTDQVCMKSMMVGTTPFGMHTVSKVDHGCFKLDHKDFIIQRAIATGPRIAV